MSDVGLSPTVSCHRRRNHKIRLQLPLFHRQPVFKSKTFSPARTSISLPEDLLREITKNLTPIDILSVSLTSHHVRELLIPVLYETVHLRSSRSCDSGLRMLAERKHLCPHIRKLAVRPNYYLSWPTRNERLSEKRVATMIVAIVKSLTHLRAFDWDGLEMPPDGLWRTLRNSCPELKEIFSNVGIRPLDPESEVRSSDYYHGALNSPQLFKFRDLTNFSISVRHGLGARDYFPSHEDLPTRLWDMIFNHCPNLRELTLCSFSASYRLFDINPVTEGYWPALSSLTLGAFGYDNDFTITAPPAASFANFLAAHPTLSSIRLAWNFKQWMSPDATIDLAFPPMLDKFSGIMQQLPIDGCSTLTSLDLMCEPLYAARAPALCHEEFFRGLWRATPRLEDLHFMCTTPFGKKPLTELARALRLLPQLHTFALTKGHRYHDESMQRSALRIFTTLMPGAGAVASQTGQMSSSDSTAIELASPHLNQLSIRWARSTCRNHLKQEGSYARIFGPPPPTSRNNHESSGEAHGMMVDAWERGLRAVGGAFERRYRFSLPHQVDKDANRVKMRSSYID
ncbi:hypothetical protein B0H12DRAFT_1156258 [Mycena haematopus]|nr:hypothetical protein B0H12DRAFT_1156258 [Mycena haematopus]